RRQPERRRQPARVRLRCVGLADGAADGLRPVARLVRARRGDARRAPPRGAAAPGLAIARRPLRAHGPLLRPPPALGADAPARDRPLRSDDTRLGASPAARLVTSGGPATVVFLARPTPRNAPCPCGSGRKHKRCCGLTREQERQRARTIEVALEIASLPYWFP